MNGYSQLFGTFVLVALAGCGSSRPDEFQISGRVAFNGQPVPAGYILFDPDIKAGNDGLQGYAEIENGYYDTSTSTKGVTGGKYIAQIHGFEMVPVPKRLFLLYRVQVDLSSTSNILDFEVPPSAGAVTDEALPPPT